MAADVVVVGVVGVVVAGVVVVVVGVIGVVSVALPIVIVTVAPFFAWLPAGGVCFRTCPTLIASPVGSVTVLTAKPAFSSAVVAATSVLPSTCGTAASFGACATTRFTFPPAGNVADGAGDCESTVSGV